MTGNAIRKATDGITDFLGLESAGGLLLVAAAALALICSHSPLRHAYDDLLKISVEVRFGSFAVAKPLLLWISDGFMAIFLLLVGVLPTFAFANAGVSFAGVAVTALAEPPRLGIALGLLVGKLAGVCGASAALIRLGLAGLPEGTQWRQRVGVAALCGVGFTMSLFIGSLAFEGPEYFTPLRLGVIVGSTLAGVMGYLLLRFASGGTRGSRQARLTNQSPNRRRPS